ncbi:proline--tRNA ligase [Candidatus Woesearchaeota archaeon]|nr:proline--tRNA ligase [Candidatus Woesearchaeota archaeon]
MSKKELTQGITAKKSDDFSEWYTQIIQKAELIEYTDVSGCLVFRPYSYQIWEKIQEFMNTIMKGMGVRNAYFPLLIPEKLLIKEADHVEGFTPEVAWVTHSGDTELKEKLAVRPTSETIMYESYKKWIRSHRDLPLLINQWCNIVRWEFKNPVPFLRTREFLWQEGHNVFATKSEMDTNTRLILESLYEKTQRELLAIPGLLGIKSEKEKFAGADYSISIENYFPSGRAIQGCTSHGLGQNFSKAFDITYIDENEKKQFAWQNSWGFSTRTIGIMIGVHSDDKGLVLPPNVAPTQIVIVPILFEKTKSETLKKCDEIKKMLKGYDVIIDDRDEYKPGYKFNDWELKGVPLRIEVGPKDIEKKQVVMSKRNTGEKVFVKEKDIKKTADKLLVDIQKELLVAAEKQLKNAIVKTESWSDFKKAIKNKKIVFSPWCEDSECEELIKHETGGAKTLNMPFDQKTLKNKKCPKCSKEAKVMCYFGKSY